MCPGLRTKDNVGSITHVVLFHQRLVRLSTIDCRDVGKRRGQRAVPGTPLVVDDFHAHLCPNRPATV